MTLKKINILEYVFGEGGGGHQKAYAVYAFINVDNCERPLIPQHNTKKKKNMKSNLCMHARKLEMLHRIFMTFGHIRWTLQRTGKQIITLNRNLCIIFCI